jgi:AcrR family transcriptional regulator
MSLRRSPKQPRGERRIETILAAAANLFDEIGYDAATTILIAQRAKTAVGSLYDFFPNKESIARALVERFTVDLRTLLDSLVSPQLVIMPFEQILDQLIDPLVELINARPGFRSLYLRTPQIGQLSEAHQALEGVMSQRIAALLRLRYPRSSPADVARTSRVCIETTKALTALAIEGGAIDEAIVADLKLMLGAFLRASFERPR